MLKFLRSAGVGEESEWEGNEREGSAFTGGKVIGVFRLQKLVDCPFCESNVYWTVHHCNSRRMKDQLDVTCYFISLLMCSTCFGH